MQTKESSEAITFPVFYFVGLNKLKKIIHESKTDLQQLIEDTKILIAVKKNPSIGNKNIRNKSLSEEQTSLPNQKCNGIGCLQCPLVNTFNTAIFKNLTVSSGKTLNCKSPNVIYLWQCQLCSQENSYFGRTIRK